MNETIGVKGGKNDRRRSIKIKEAKKKKIEESEKDEELLELEKKVKKQQAFTLIKTLPIAIAGGTIKTIYDTATGKSYVDKDEYNSNWKIKEYDSDYTTLQHGEKPKEKKVVLTPDGKKVIVYVDVDDKKNILEDILILPKPVDVRVDEIPKTNEGDIEVLDDKKEVKKTSPISGIVNTNFSTSNTTSDNNKNKSESKSEDIIEGKPIGIGDVSYDNSYIDFGDLSNVSNETINKLKARKILDVYEKKLKDVRYELRLLTFDYNALIDAEDEIVLSSDAQIILDRLSDIISKIEELKARIKIDNLDKYDDNYIYSLIEGYLAEFKDQKVVSEIKDSPLYLLISKKLDELDSKKTDLNNRVEKKKDSLEEKEEVFEELKKKYSNLDRFNQEMRKFQEEQEFLLKELQEKVRTAESVEQRIRYEMQAMNKQTKRAMHLLTLQMMFPGPAIAKGLAATAASSLYFMNNIIKPKMTRKRYRVIKVIDYSSDIKNNISLVENAMSTLNKTSSQIDKMISTINIEYSDYFGVVPECDELISNLKKIKNDIEEKEYEMEKVKEQQRLLLEKNNAKVLKRGEYTM